MASTAPARHRHRRVYQACEPCRLKKIRCELGSVDHPTAYPCARCRREDRECYFAALRDRKAAALQELTGQRNKRKATSPAEGGTAAQNQQQHPSTSKSPPPQLRKTADSTQERQTRRQTSPFSPFPENGRAAAALLRGHPRTYHDALTLLSEACEHSDHLKTPQSGPSRCANSQNKSGNSNSAGESSSSATGGAVESRRSETLQALKAWSNVRFVRGGLFTAEEALDMVDQFYNFQAPFSPVVPECFKEHSQHAALIEDEPILTVTMLMVGSRYRVWTGPAASARSYIVHDRLWRYLQGMISRIFWSEDNFVGEFTSLADYYVSQQTDSQYPLAGNWSNGFRTLGTCEALLILLDWHPRSLHFPPIDEDTTSIVLREAKKQRRATTAENGYGRGGPESGHDWLARSDRLGRSMLSTASMLATEIGLFDDHESSANYGSDMGCHNSREAPSERLRVYRLRQLIWVYATQQPGRPGWRILTPAPLRSHPGTEEDDTTECWFRVATLMKRANELLFISHSHTNELIQSGEYLNILQTFRPLLGEFAVKFDQSRLTRQTRLMLTIEYAYVRLCIYSVALQAVINRRYYNNGRDADAQGTIPSISRQEEEEHLTQTIKAAQQILRTVVDELIPDNYMRYIPVRSYSRILGAALFLLKACAAGVPEINVPTSHRLITGIAAGFRTHAIDETSLTIRWGELLDRLSTGLQARLTTSTTTTTTNTSTTSARPKNPIASNSATEGGPSDAQPPGCSLGTDPSTVSAAAIQAPASSVEQTANMHDIPVVSNPAMPDMGLNPSLYHESSHRVGPEYGTNPNSETFTMWWDLLCPSQAMSFNEVPWYPALGIVEGNEGVFTPGATGDGGMEQASSGLLQRLYE